MHNLNVYTQPDHSNSQKKVHKEVLLKNSWGGTFVPVRCVRGMLAISFSVWHLLYLHESTWKCDAESSGAADCAPFCYAYANNHVKI